MWRVFFKWASDDILEKNWQTMLSDHWPLFICSFKILFPLVLYEEKSRVLLRSKSKFSSLRVKIYSVRKHVYCCSDFNGDEIQGVTPLQGLSDPLMSIVSHLKKPLSSWSAKYSSSEHPQNHLIPVVASGIIHKTSLDHHRHTCTWRGLTLNARWHEATCWTGQILNCRWN